MSGSLFGSFPWVPRGAVTHEKKWEATVKETEEKEDSREKKVFI